MRGTFNGQSFDEKCTAESFFASTIGAPPRWTIACDVPMAGKYYLATDVLVQGPGVFDVNLVKGSNSKGDVIVAMGDAQGSSAEADNFVSGRYAGQVVAESATANVVSGTFKASWSEPAAGCMSAYADACVAATLHGTFRAVVPPP